MQINRRLRKCEFIANKFENQLILVVVVLFIAVVIALELSLSLSLSLLATEIYVLYMLATFIVSS